MKSWWQYKGSTELIGVDTNDLQKRLGGIREIDIVEQIWKLENEFYPVINLSIDWRTGMFPSSNLQIFKFSNCNNVTAKKNEAQENAERSHEGRH